MTNKNIIKTFYYDIFDKVKELSNKEKTILSNSLQNPLEYAALNGDLEFMRRLTENGFLLKEGVFEKAAENGNFENMKWLKEQGCPWNSWTFLAACANGNLNNLRWLKDNRCFCRDDDRVYLRAASNGNLETLRWLKLNDFPFDFSHYQEHIQYLNPEIREWIKEQEN